MSVGGPVPPKDTLDKTMVLSAAWGRIEGELDSPSKLSNFRQPQGGAAAPPDFHLVFYARKGKRK
jgi:hypothetical protein